MIGQLPPPLPINQYIKLLEKFAWAHIINFNTGAEEVLQYTMFFVTEFSGTRQRRGRQLNDEWLNDTDQKLGEH